MSEFENSDPEDTDDSDYDYTEATWEQPPMSQTMKKRMELSQKREKSHINAVFVSSVSRINISRGYPPVSPKSFKGQIDPAKQDRSPEMENDDMEGVKKPKTRKDGKKETLKPEKDRRSDADTGAKGKSQPLKGPEKMFVCVDGIDREESNDTVFKYLEGRSKVDVIFEESLRTTENPEHAVIVFADRVDLKSLKRACDSRKLKTSRMTFDELDPPRTVIVSSEDDGLTENKLQDHLKKKKIGIVRTYTTDEGTIYVKLRNTEGVIEFLKSTNTKIEGSKIVISVTYNCDHGTYWDHSLHRVAIPAPDKKHMKGEHLLRDDNTTRTVRDLLKELNELGLETVSEFKQMLQQGTYKCFWNRVYLVGPYGVGKTTLAKLLVGEEIPDEWNSTDGIFIYLGRAAMDTESKQWVLLKKGTILNAAVMSLLKSRENTSTLPKVTQPLQELSEALPVTTENASIKRPVEKKRFTLGAVGRVDSTTSKESDQGGPSDDEIVALVLNECHRGDYKMIVVPIDIWDFGGQKIYYLTHQLFISSRGTFVVTFNGSKDIKENMPEMTFLPGFKGKTTTAAFLLHWVNSVLTFCEITMTHSGRKYPRILFVATHKDKMANAEEQRNIIKNNLKMLFRNHAGKDHLLIDQLFFLNAKDKHDKDLAALRKTLIDVAFEHPYWGELMPTKFVPLELQLAKQASEGKKILSITEVQNLNNKNKGMSLKPKELYTFLKVQHALGKLIYFDEDKLRDFVVTDPAYLIDVLRSIVTEKLFWPKNETVRETFENLSTTGIIKKSSILRLWQQNDFIHIFQFSEFMINMLVRLDIMLEPKTKSDSSYFIVPSMITDRPFENTFQKEKCIYLAYQFTKQIIPPALLYRFLGSFIVLRNLNTDITYLRLFTDSAVVTIDSKHQVQAYVVGNRIILALMHEQSKSDIKPSIASTVQECLTRSIIRTTDFYCAIANTSNLKNMQFPFIIEVGVPCTDGLCFVEHNERTTAKGQHWMCKKHTIQHNMTHTSLWFSDKEPIQDEECPKGCPGLERSWLLRNPEAKHLRRLGALLTHEQTRRMLLCLGLSTEKLNNLETQLDKRDLEDMHFYAFWYWKESSKSPTFSRLLETLQNNELNACLLCKVVCDIKLEEDFPVDMMRWIPDDTTLENLSHHVGYATFQLGIELGLSVTDLQNIERNEKDLIEQTRKVLTKWKESCDHENNEPPVIALAKSLKRVGKYILISNLMDNFESAY